MTAVPEPCEVCRRVPDRGCAIADRSERPYPACPALEQIRAWNQAAQAAAVNDPARAGYRHWNQADRRRQAPR